MMQYTLFDAPPINPVAAAPSPTTKAGELRVYQLDVETRARKHIAAGKKRGIIQGETGSGKSANIAYMAKLCLEKNRRCLILADRRRLITQMGGMLNNFEVPFGIIMAGETRHTHYPCIVASKDTIASWGKREFDMPEPFDLIMTDEAHRGMAESYQRLYQWWPNAVSVGFTATPARADGKFLSDYFQWLECMVPASQLIAEGWLIKPEVYVPLELAKRRKNGKRPKGLCGDPVDHWKMHAFGLPTIAFCAKIKESTALLERFTKAGISCEHVDADSTDDERDACYKRLANGTTKVVTSVGLLIEGVDIPEASCAILWHKFGSVVMLRQACGRIMRPCERINKTRAVVLDHAGACAEHGCPGDDLEWSLDKDSTVQERRAKALLEGKLNRSFACGNCGCVFHGSTCPSCGTKVNPRNSFGPAEELSKAQDELLSRYDGTPEQNEAKAKEVAWRTWVKCVMMAVARRQSVKYANVLFKRFHGCWPNKSEIKANCPPFEEGAKPVSEMKDFLLNPKPPSWAEYQRAKERKLQAQEEEAF